MIFFFLNLISSDIIQLEPNQTRKFDINLNKGESISFTSLSTPLYFLFNISNNLNISTYSLNDFNLITNYNLSEFMCINAPNTEIRITSLSNQNLQIASFTPSLCTGYRFGYDFSQSIYSVFGTTFSTIFSLYPNDKKCIMIAPSESPMNLTITANFNINNYTFIAYQITSSQRLLNDQFSQTITISEPILFYFSFPSVCFSGTLILNSTYPEQGAQNTKFLEPSSYATSIKCQPSSKFFLGTIILISVVILLTIILSIAGSIYRLKKRRTYINDSDESSEEEINRMEPNFSAKSSSSIDQKPNETIPQTQFNEDPYNLNPLVIPDETSELSDTNPYKITELI